MADAGRGDWVLCQITSNPYGHNKALQTDERRVSVPAYRWLNARAARG